MSGLSQYLERKRAALEASPYHGTAYDFAASATAEGLSGVRRIRIRDFQVITDSGPAGAGFSLGPAPGELLAGALAACINHGYLIQAATLGVNLHTLEITAKGRSVDVTKVDANDRLEQVGISFSVTLTSDGTDEELETIHQRAVANSFVYNLLVHRTPIEGGWQRAEAGGTP